MTVAPKKELGQHFLVDENILAVIGRLAELEPADVVLEVGPGLGVLTRYLAERVSSVHAVEIDRSLEAALDGIPHTTIHWGDALALDPSTLDPPPGKLVANLPYNVATPLVVESLDRYPSLGLWCVMVQREVADRFFATPRTKAYGAVSVLVQLVAERTGFHAVSREVFRPRPNVDSALVAFRRIGPGIDPRGQAARRGVVCAPAKDARELGGALRARVPAAGHSRARGNRPRLRAPGPRSSARRSSSRSPKSSDELQAEGRRVINAVAPAKINLALVVGPTRPDGMHEVATLLQRIDLADTVSLEQADELVVEGFPADTLVRDALLAIAAAAGVEPRWRARLEKRIPVAAGLGGGSSDAATALRLACRLLDDPPSPERLHGIAAALGVDVAFFVADGPQLATGTGTTLQPVALSQDYTVVVLLPHGEQKPSTAEIYRRFDGAAGFPERRAQVLAAVAAGDLTALPPNDLASLAAQPSPARPGCISGGRQRCGPRDLRALHGA